MNISITVSWLSSWPTNTPRSAYITVTSTMVTVPLTTTCAMDNTANLIALALMIAAMTTSVTTPARATLHSLGSGGHLDHSSSSFASAPWSPVPNADVALRNITHQFALTMPLSVISVRRCMS